MSGLSRLRSDRPRVRQQRAIGPNDSRLPDGGGRYGLRPDEVAAMIARQGGDCLLCGEPLGTTFVIDHDHRIAAAFGDTVQARRRAVRGLTCRRCNSIIGWGREDSAFFRRVAAYIDMARDAAGVGRG